MRAAAIQFPLAHPAVAGLIAGVRRVEHLDEYPAFMRWPIPAGLWDDLRSEGLIEPEAPDAAMSPVVDAHHHLLDPARFDYPWLTPELAAIDRRFGPEDLAPELAAAGIDRTILVQTIGSLEETREFLATAAAVAVHRRRDRLGRPDRSGRQRNARRVARAGRAGSGSSGSATRSTTSPIPDWLLRPDVRRGLAAIEAAGPHLRPPCPHARAAGGAGRGPGDARAPVRDRPPGEAADPLGRHRAVGEPAPPVRRAPERVVQAVRPRHRGGSWRRGRSPTWRRTSRSPSRRSARERLLFGSDWPVCLLAASYADVAAAARRPHADLSSAERAAVFGGAAEAAYRLSVSPDRVG